MKKQCSILFVVILFVSICYAEKNKYGYSISAKLFNKDNIGIAVANREIAYFVIPCGMIVPIFAENKYQNWSDANIRYFYILNSNAYSFFGDPSNYKKFSFKVNSKLDKRYISVEDAPILPYSEAYGIYRIISCALGLECKSWPARAEYLFKKIVGKKTGIKNSYTKKQIVEIGKKLREAPLENWKNLPNYHILLVTGMINYWNKYKNNNDYEVIEWLAKIVKYENLSNYDDLLEYNEKIKNMSKNIEIMTETKKTGTPHKKSKKAALEAALERTQRQIEYAEQQERIRQQKAQERAEAEIATETKEQETSYQEYEQRERATRQTWENLRKFLWYGGYASHIPLEKGDRILVPQYLMSIVDVDVVNGKYSYLFTSTGISEISQYAYIITKRQLSSIRNAGTNLVMEPVVIQCEGKASYKRGLSVVDTYVFTLVE